MASPPSRGLAHVIVAAYQLRQMIRICYFQSDQIRPPAADVDHIVSQNPLEVRSSSDEFQSMQLCLTFCQSQQQNTSNK